MSAILCGQDYVGFEMRVTPCDRCRNWRGTRCSIETGAEHLPLVPASEVPVCPIQDHCQHQVQAGAEPCPVRARGMICESALVFAGMSRSDAMSHPLSYNAIDVATPEDMVEFEDSVWRDDVVNRRSWT